MRKQNIPTPSVSYIFWEKQKSIQFPKMGIVKLLSTAKIMGKHKYSKGFGFLYIPHYSISREIETHTIPKTWEITEFS